MTRLLHGPGQAPARPIRVPFVFGTLGPRGEAVARELGQGVLTVRPTPGFVWSTLLIHGTVLEPGEAFEAPRVLAAAGAGAAVALHRAYEFRNVPGLDPGPLLGARQWQAAIEAIPERERHLVTHEGHLTFLNAIDRSVITGDLIRTRTFTGEAAALRERLGQLAGQGVTEIAFQPKGPRYPSRARRLRPDGRPCLSGSASVNQLRVHHYSERALRPRP